MGTASNNDETRLDHRELTFAELEALADVLVRAQCEAMLLDGRAIVRANGLRALAVLGVASPGMVPLLRDSEESVALAAADAIERLKGAIDALIPSIIQALNDTRPEVRERVLDALATLVGTADEALIEALDGPPESVQSAAVEAPLRAGRAGALLLSRALLSERTLVRYNSACGLTELASAGLFATMGVDRHVVETLVHVSDHDDAADVRAAAVGALAALVKTEREQAQILAQREVAAAGEIAIDGFAERPLAGEFLQQTGEIGPDSGASTQDLESRLLVALHDGRPLVRANATRVLAALGPERAGGSVRAISVLLRDTEPPVRLAAAQALDALRPASAEVATALVEALGARDEKVASAAQGTLEGLGEAAVAALLEGLASERRESGRERILALIHARPDAVDLLARAFLDPRVDVQVSAALSLGRLGAARVGAGRRVLEAARTGGDARTRAAVRAALVMLDEWRPPGPSPTDQLAAAIPGFTGRWLTAEDLAGAPSVNIEWIVQALGDGRAPARANAATALATHGSAAADHARLLIVLLRDSDPSVALAAARALTALGAACAPVVRTMAQALDGVHPRVREQILELLVALVGATDDALIDALDVSPESYGQDAAVEALVRAGRRGALVLARALTKEQTLVRYNSAQGIQRIARAGALDDMGIDRTIVESLESVRAGDDASDVRAAADLALSAIVAARQDEAARYKADIAAQAATLAIPGFAERPLSDDELAAQALESDADRERIALALRDGRPLVRVNAARLLASYSAEDADDGGAATASDIARAIAVLLRDSDAAVRRSAADALVAMGERAPATLAHVADALVGALADADPQVSGASARALRSLGDLAVSALAHGLDTDNSQQIRRVVECIHALPDAERVLCQAFASPSATVRVNAAYALAALGPDRVTIGLRVLAAARTGGDAATRNAARAALALLTPPAPAGPPAIDIPGFHERSLPMPDRAADVSPDSLLAALGDPRPATRCNSARFLAAASLPVEQIAGALSVLMRDGEPSVRAAAASALGALGPGAAAGAHVLVRALADDHREVVESARHSLTSLGSHAVPALARGLDTDDREHADAVLDLLIPMADAGHLLADWFAHGSELVRANAARGLGRLSPSPDRAVRNLLEAARTNASKRVRAAVADALAALAEPDEPGPPAIAIPGFTERVLGAEELPASALADVPDASLIAALGDGHATTRANALTALGNLDDRAAPYVRLIAVQLRDGDLPVARSAAAALASLGARVADVVPDIARARDDAHPDIGERIIEILVGLVGKADDALVAALDVSPELGQDAVVEALMGAGQPGALLLVRALLVERTLERFNSARGIERLARRGALAETGVDAQILQALSTVRYTDDAVDVRSAASAAISAMTAARASAAMALAQKRAREASAIAVPGFFDGIVAIEELKERVSIDDLDRYTMALRDGNPLVRGNAAHALAALGPERAGHTARAISVLLRDTDGPVRQAAARSLAALGYAAAPVARALVAALGSDDPGVWQAADSALRELGERASSALVDGLGVDSSTHAERVIECLCALPEGASVLAQAFSSPSVDVQVNAARGLGMLGRDRVGDGLALLQAARTGGDRRTQAAVRAALDALAPPAEPGPPAIEVPGFDERILSAAELASADIPLASALAAMTDARPIVRANVATALATGTADEAHFLAIMLRDGEPLVRAAAARALTSPGLWASADIGPGDGILGALVDALADADPSVAQAAEQALRARGDQAGRALYRGLSTDSPAHAQRIATLVGETSDPVALLVPGLSDPSVDIQVAAALGLGMLGPERIGAGRQALLNARAAGDRRTRAAVRRALSSVAPALDPEPPTILIGGFHARVMPADSLSADGISIDSILSALRDGRVATRTNAATLLGKSGAAAGPYVHALAVLLRDSSTQVRLAAAQALAMLGPLAASEADALVAALGDRDTGVASAAGAAIANLGADVRAALVRGLASDLPRQVDGVLALIARLDDPVDLLCDAFTSDSTDVQVSAAIGLGRLGRERVGKGLDVLRIARMSSDRRTRAAARDALLVLDPPRERPPTVVAIDGFYERLLTDRECAATDRSAIDMDALFDALKDGRDVVRANAVTALGAFAAADQLVPMSVLLRDGSPGARMAAARALGRLGEAAAQVADALAAALGDRTADVVQAVFATLQGLGESVAPALIRALDTDDEAYADRLLRLLEPMPSAAELLFAAFQSPALHVKINAAHGLGRLGAERVGQERIDALDDEQWYGDLRKRQAVRRALREFASQG